MPTKMFLIPPVECLENGCKLKTSKCERCEYKDCYWFTGQADIAENNEICYNEGKEISSPLFKNTSNFVK